MSKKVYGSYTDSELNQWQSYPHVVDVLTSAAFGAWLMRHDSNRESSIEEKQVILSGDGMWDGQIVYDTGECPECGWQYELDDKDWEEPYCCHCGSKLHWFNSEDENEDE